MTSDDREVMRVWHAAEWQLRVETLRALVIEEQRQEWLTAMCQLNLSVYRGTNWLEHGVVDE